MSNLRQICELSSTKPCFIELLSEKNNKYWTQFLPILFNPFATGTRICVNFSTVYNDTLVAKGLITLGFIWSGPPQGRDYHWTRVDKVQGAPECWEAPEFQTYYIVIEKKTTLQYVIISHKNVCSNSSWQNSPTTEITIYFQNFSRAYSRVSRHDNTSFGTSNREWNSWPTIYGAPLDILSRSPRVPSYATGPPTLFSFRLFKIFITSSHKLSSPPSLSPHPLHIYFPLWTPTWRIRSMFLLFITLSLW